MAATVLTDAHYAPLRKYLGTRFADTVVLKFGEIEDLLGIPLPEMARVQAGWWAAVAGERVGGGEVETGKCGVVREVERGARHPVRRERGARSPERTRTGWR